MGAGVALQAKERYPNLPKYLGQAIRLNGNLVHNCGRWGDDDSIIFSFPTKVRWSDPSDLNLIAASALQLARHVDEWRTEHEHPKYPVIALPRVGCGAGGLSWGEVQPLLANILDDRFVVISKTLTESKEDAHQV